MFLRQPHTGIHLYVEDSASYLQFLRRCKNYSQGCRQTFRTKEVLEKHEEKCKTVNEVHENPTIKQQFYGYSEHPLEYLKSTLGIVSYVHIPIVLYSHITIQFYKTIIV